MGLSDHYVAVAGAGIGAGALLYYLARPAQPEVPGPEETGFGAYLRDLSVGVPTHGTPSPSAFEETSFEAYLRAAAFKPKDQTQGGAMEAQQTAPVPAEARPVTIMFGTEYGFSKEIAERLADKLKASCQDYWPLVLDMADYPKGLPELASQQALILICSTQGDGVPPAEARGFCDWLAGLGGDTLDGVPFSVCALGDTTYTHFCRCGRTIDAGLEAAGGSRFAPIGEINREDYTAVDAWIDGVLGALGSLDLSSVAELEGTDALVLLSGDASDGEEKHKGFSRNRPFLSSVTAVESLCVLDGPDDKNTVRVEFDLGDSGLSYTPGDALGVWSSNDPQAVEELLEALGADGSAPVKVPSWHYADPLLQEGATTISLRDALTRCYDIRQPKPVLFAILRDALKDGLAGGGATDAQDSGTGVGADGRSDKLEELEALLASPEAGEAYLEPRHVIDVLRAFHPARPGIGDLLRALRQLAPRLYSISGSQREGALQVQATVAVVRYVSLDVLRGGVASTAMGERALPGQLPADLATPIIMVGPGTGLAPFRSFLMERHLSAAEGQKLGDALLFFGCRRRDQDYLYGELLEAWAAEEKIKLYTAFSRQDPESKVYVQQRLTEAAGEVWAALESGGHFYVCGDAASMAGQVEKALLALISERGGADASGARAYLDAMTAAGRYQRDVWF